MTDEPWVPVKMVDRFYVELMFQLEEHARGGGTAIGFGAVIKRVAREVGLDEVAQRHSVARLSRQDQEIAAEKRWLKRQGRGVRE